VSPRTTTESRPPRAVSHPSARGDFNARMLLVVTTLLVSFGTIAVASASEGQAVANGGSSYSIILRDLIYLGFGILAAYATARLRLDGVVRKAPLLILVGLGLLAAVKLVGITSDGGKRWLNLHVIYLQPSEMFKLFTVLFLAWLVQHHHAELNNWKQLAIWTMPVTIGAVLVLDEPDIGTATVIVSIAFVVLAVAGLSKVRLAQIIGIGIAIFLVYMKLKPYSARRFFAFVHPSKDLLGSGYQLMQSKIGLGAGGLTGLGLGNSREKFGLLPNPHTDFIFTIIGEELGLIGSLTVIGLFVWFLFVATRIAKQCTNATYRLVAVGITTWIVLEAIINIASVVGGWAVTGIPLPFFSYGGTALITELAAVGLLYNIARDNSHTADLEIAQGRASINRGGYDSRSSGARAPRTRSGQRQGR
jgi:cell division protein FtsW